MDINFFLGGVLTDVNAIYCCMKKFSNYFYSKIGAPVPKHHKLINAVNYVYPTFKYKAQEAQYDLLNKN